jgi:hypothetical protein
MDKLNHPELHNFLARESFSLFSPENVPFVFFAAWLMLFSFSVLALLPLADVNDLIGLNMPTVATALLIALIAAAITWAIKESLRTGYERHHALERRK